jgi:hypothetical protein
VLGLEEHYARSELEARVQEDGSVDVAEPKNVTRFAILPPVLQGAGAKLRVGGKPVALPERNDSRPREPVIAKRDGRWTYLGERDTLQSEGKRPGLQGPIDDAFTTPFLCVRGTGQPWNPEVQAWSEASLKRFAHEWRRYFRGELPIKNDTDVTAEDVQRCNLILFCSAIPATTRGSPGLRRNCLSVGRRRQWSFAASTMPRPIMCRC